MGGGGWEEVLVDNIYAKDIIHVKDNIRVKVKAHVNVKVYVGIKHSSVSNTQAGQKC